MDQPKFSLARGFLQWTEKSGLKKYKYLFHLDPGDLPQGGSIRIRIHFTGKVVKISYRTGT